MNTDEKVAKALHEAVSAICGEDDSDYLQALWTIVAILGGKEAVELLDANPDEAHIKYAQFPEI